MTLVAIVPTDVVCQFGTELGDILAGADPEAPTPEEATAYHAAAIVHREMIIRHLFVDALDLFNRACRILDPLDGEPYSEYVDDILRTVGDDLIDN
jgi:hypothetical protein